MNPEAPFLDAIRANPNDVVSRLVYADWLEDRGDQRGELIRIEEEMRLLPVFSDRYWDLRRPRNALREEVATNWLQTMGYVPAYRPLFSKLPARRVERWRLVQEFIELWHQPLGPQGGSTEAEIHTAEVRLGHRLPAALREWYLLAGNQTRIWSRQDHLCEPHQLKIERGALIFRRENQRCEIWGVRLEDLRQEDPPVCRFLQETAEESPTVTAFAIVTLLMETIWSELLYSNEGAYLSELVSEVAKNCVRCDLPSAYWACNPVYFYEGNDIYFVESQFDGYLYVPARDESAFQQLSSTLRQHLIPCV